MKETQTLDKPTLRATDLCDAGCGAAARVRVKGVQGELDFCGHHFAKFEKGLDSWAYDVIDERN